MKGGYIISIKRAKSGAIFIEILMDIMILAMISVAVFSSFSISMKAIKYYKHKAIAADIANKEIEEIRALPYIEVGTTGSVPSGEREPQKTIDGEDGIKYWVATEITYVDDPADGKASAIDPEKYIITDPTTYKTSSDGSDTEPYDYKKVKITVSTDDRHDRILATIISDVASAVAETLNETGALEICLSDSDGQVVKDGKVLIELEENENYHSQGALHIERTVDDETGCIFQPNLEVIVNEADPGNPVPDSNLYRILGFYGPDDTSYSSTYRYVNVITQQLSRYSLTIGQWKELTINAKYLDGTPVISPSIEIFGSDGLLRSKSGDVNGKATFTKSDQLPPIQYFFYRSTINSGSEYIYPVYFSVPEFWDLNVWKKFNEDRGSTDYTNLELDGYFTSDPSLPQHLEISPNMVVQQNDVYVRVSGRNLSDDSIVKLISESGVEINAGYDSPKYVTNDPPDGYDYVECVFNLSGADTGKYDVVISNLGKSVTIPDYFEITI